MPIFETISNIGLRAAHTDKGRLSMQLVNQLCWLGILVMLLHLPLDIWQGRPADIIGSLVAVGLFLIPIALNGFQRPRTAKVSLYLLMAGYVAITSWLFSNAGHVNVVFVLVVLLPLILFQRPLLAYWLAGLGVIIFSLVYFFQPDPPLIEEALNSEALNWYRYSNYLIPMLGMGLAIFFYRRLTRQYEQHLDAQNQQLVAQKTALEQANEQLSQAMEQLKLAQLQVVQSEKMASLGQLTAGIAHELNNPINYLKANAKPLRMDVDELLSFMRKLEAAKLEDPQQLLELKALMAELEVDVLRQEIDTLVEGIEEGASRTANIVAGLRNFSRLDEDDFKMADIHLGLESTLTLMHNRLKKGIAVTKEFGKLPYIECLPGKLNQVFMNLLTNAADAMEEEGNIAIRTWDAGELIGISIEDDGPGIPIDIQNRIFDPFFTTKEIGKGTGLGLSIVYGIIEQHHGTIEMECGEKGTTFTIFLPKQQPPKDS